MTIAGDKLNDTKALVDIGKEIPLPSTVRETQKALSKKVFRYKEKEHFVNPRNDLLCFFLMFLLLFFSLEESGQTALGPALLVSIVVASQCPGSKVILCTDGLANIGVGAMDSECWLHVGFHGDHCVLRMYSMFANFVTQWRGPRRTLPGKMLPMPLCRLSMRN